MHHALELVALVVLRQVESALASALQGGVEAVAVDLNAHEVDVGVEAEVGAAQLGERLLEVHHGLIEPTEGEVLLGEEVGHASPLLLVGGGLVGSTSDAGVPRHGGKDLLGGPRCVLHVQEAVAGDGALLVADEGLVDLVLPAPTVGPPHEPEHVLLGVVLDVRIPHHDGVRLG